MHLQEQGTEVKWASTYSTHISSLTNYLTSRNACTDFNGYSNTQKIRTAGNATLYPAAWAVDYNNGWYLPAAGQLRLLSAELMTINASLQVVAGTQFLTDYYTVYSYWSSTYNWQGSYEWSHAWNVRLDNGQVSALTRITPDRVRSVCNF